MGSESIYLYRISDFKDIVYYVFQSWKNSEIYIEVVKLPKGNFRKDLAPIWILPFKARFTTLIICIQITFRLATKFQTAISSVLNCLSLIRITIQREANKAKGWFCFLATFDKRFRSSFIPFFFGLKKENYFDHLQ